MIPIDIIVRTRVRACVCVKFEIIYNYFLLYHFAFQIIIY